MVIKVHFAYANGDEDEVILTADLDDMSATVDIEMAKRGAQFIDYDIIEE